MKTLVWFWFVLGALSAAGKVFHTKPGHKVTLECGTNSFKNSLVWKREDSLIISIDGKSGFPRKGRGDIVSRAKVKQNTFLEITSVKAEDAGRFTCTADSRSADHTLLIVSVSTSPSGALQLGSKATLHCQVKGLKPSPAVQWKRPDGTLHTESVLTSVERSDAGTWQCTFSYDGVIFTESLVIIVEEPSPVTTATSPSQHSKDGAKPTCHDCVTPSSPHLWGVSWWVWVVSGVGCLVMVLLMICVIVLCKRIKRRKRKMQKMKNGRQLLKPKNYCKCDCPTAAAKSQQGRRREKPSSLPLQPLLTVT